MPDSNQMFGKSSGDTPDFFDLLCKNIGFARFIKKYTYEKFIKT